MKQQIKTKHNRWIAPSLPVVILVISLFAYFMMRNDVDTVDTSKLAVVSSDNELDIDEVFRLVNAERHVRNLPELSIDPVLQQVAQDRARDMSENEYYSHRDQQGILFSHLLKQKGFSFDYACENLALEFTENEFEYIDSWLNSKTGHRECLLNPDVSHAGYAISILRDNYSFRVYIVVGIHAESLKEIAR